MCRLECDCQPSGCATRSQKSRFIVTPVEEQPTKDFVRNKNVKFFAAESDDSDYEEDQLESAGYGSSFYEETRENDNVSDDDDSGFVDESENDETKSKTPESTSISTEKRDTPIKSILRRPKKDSAVKGQVQKKVHFANPVATYRLIPSRHEQQLVEIDSAIFDDRSRTLLLFNRVGCY